MSDLAIRNRRGDLRTVSSAAISRLGTAVQGTIFTRDTPGYEEARAIWNAMIDRRPAMIVRCRVTDDVLHAVLFARELDLLVSVRGGGHNIAGSALVDDGFVIDLSAMRGVHVDSIQRTARAEPGLTLGGFDRSTQEYGLATPLGINSTTGIAGLTLGGGYGWLSRAHGLSIDNLRAVQVVTADGDLLNASERENSDLFWALRGGGGNFGIATRFDYALHPVGPTVHAGLIVHPFDDAATLLRRYRDVMAAAPDRLSAWVVMRKAPPLPFLPESVHGREVVVIATCFSGPHAEADEALRPLRAIGQPIADVVAPTPYVAFQSAFDPLLTPGARNYWKTHNFSTLHDGLIDRVVEQVRALPGPLSEIFLAHLGGAVSRRSDEATAYSGRDAQFVMNVHGRWESPDEDDRFVGWARDVHKATAPFASAGAYVNFLTSDEQDRVRAAYGANYERLAAIKAKYDGDNFFRTNQNIVPAAQVPTPSYLVIDQTAETPPPPM